MDFDTEYTFKMYVNKTATIKPSDVCDREEWEKMDEDDRLAFLSSEVWGELEQHIQISLIED